MDKSPSEGMLAARRHEMVVRQLRDRGVRDPRVLAAFEDVPRERFLPPEQIYVAYADHPVPIGGGQTISQPYVVGLMVEELDVRSHHRVLDVGVGSGYQTAILARLARRVYGIERIDELTQSAQAVLDSLGVRNVTLQTGDGTLGWPEEAPFDRIICGAAGPEVPAAWTEQLADGGRIVLPIGGEEYQTLVRIERRGKEFTRRQLCDVRFVKLIGRQAWPE